MLNSIQMIPFLLLNMALLFWMLCMAPLLLDW